MTDKELRKLSRLELLELLLEASKENEKLREEAEKLKSESITSQNIENLTVATQQVENALRYASSLTASLKAKEGIPVTYTASSEKKKDTAANREAPSDREIYRRILCFFAENDDKLDVFPDDIGKDVRKRIRSLLERKNAN